MLHEVIADVLAPRVCVGCEEEGSWLCDPCAAGIEQDPNATCLGCERLSRLGATCERCRRDIPLRGVVAIASYRDHAVQRVIQTVKYASARDAAGAFAVLVRDAFERAVFVALRAEVGEAPLLLPVPLHWRRRAERGFNQSVCIAEAVAAAGWGTLASPGVLRRRKCSLPQVTLPHAQRLRNVADAFACVNPSAIIGRSVVLVDDVVTTGATMSACARSLRLVGVTTIWGFAIARG